MTQVSQRWAENERESAIVRMQELRAGLRNVIDQVGFALAAAGFGPDHIDAYAPALHESLMNELFHDEIAYEKSRLEEIGHRPNVVDFSFKAVMGA